MAAAALLRSMARKLARTPPPHPRPLLAGGHHGGARSGHGGSFPPLTGNQTREMSGERLVAATARLRSGTALPSLATKRARAPSPTHHRRILNRGLHSGSTPPPTTDKDKIIADLRRRLWYSRASAAIAGFTLTGAAIHGYFWLLPEVEKERERLRAMKKLKPEDEHPSVYLTQIIARKGYRKQQRIAEEGAMVDMLLNLMEFCLDVLMESTEARANLEETRAAMERITKLDPSKQKEGCSRVG